MSIESLTKEALQHHRKGDYSQALDTYQNVLKRLEAMAGKTDDETRMQTAECYRSMGAVMEDSGDFDKAFEYFDASIRELKLVETDSNANNEAVLAQGEICEIVGNMLYKREDYNGAIEKLSEALQILKETPGASPAKVEEIEYLLEISNMMAD